MKRLSTCLSGRSGPPSPPLPRFLPLLPFLGLLLLAAACVGPAGRLGIPDMRGWTVRDGTREITGSEFFRNGWRCDATAAAGERSLVVDWGRPAMVYGFSMRWRDGEAPARYGVSLSRNGRKWESVHEKTAVSAGTDYWAIEPRLARAARITVPDGAATLERLWPVGIESRPQVRVDGDDTPGAIALIDGLPETSWGEPDGEPGLREISIDWGSARPALGVRIDWAEGKAPPRNVEVWVSGDGVLWSPLGDAKREEDENADILLGEEERPVRWARLEIERGPEAWAIGGIERRGAEGAGRAWNLYAESLRAGAALGGLPAALADGARPLWTSAEGPEADAPESVLSADGAWGVAKNGPSLWPVVRVGETWLSPSGAASAECGVAGEGAPMPTAEWRWDAGPALSVRLMSTPEGPWAEWTLRNDGDAPLEGEWGWVLRPMRAAPPWAGGGVTPVARVRGGEAGGWREIRVNGTPVVAAEGPGWSFGAASRAAGGEIAAWSNASPAAVSNAPAGARGARDTDGLASAVLKRPFSLAPGESDRALLAGPASARHRDWPTNAADRFDALWTARADAWRDATSGYAPALGTDTALAALARMQLSWILGARTAAATPEDSFARLTALLYGGRTAEALAETRRWLDAARGLFGEGGSGDEARRIAADRERSTLSPAVCGQFVHGVAEVWRFTGDDAFLSEAYPVLRRTMLDVAALTEAPPKPPSTGRRFLRWLTGHRGPPPAGGPVSGLVADRAAGAGGVAVHDTASQLWALLAWKDLRDAATALGLPEDADWAASRADSLRNALRVALGVIGHRETHPRVAASVESPEGLGGTSAAALAVWPCGEESLVPAAMLQNTLDAVYARFLRWAVETDGPGAVFLGDAAYLTPLARLGHRDYANEMLRDLSALLAPPAWAAPPALGAARPPARESARPDPRTAALLFGALRQAALCEDGPRLHLLCGAPPEWFRGDSGFSVSNAPTAFGPVSLRAMERGRLFRAVLSGNASPPGGFRLWFPRDTAPERVLVDRRATTAFSPLWIDLPADFRGTVEAFYPEPAPSLRGD